MALLDFVKNRQANQQQDVAGKSQQQKPETAKQMYAREAAQEKTNAKPMDQMRPEQQAKVEQIKATLEKSTQHMNRDAAAPASAPANDGGNTAHMQKQNNQEKTQAALSPTDNTAGKTAIRGQDKTPEKAAPEKPQTLPRPRPSWER
jgi:hypothetical protein